jgi:4-hydroxybenzoate polyprenyltransferase
VEAEFPADGGRGRPWLKALRLHQWSKNLLILVPLLLSSQFLEPSALIDVAVGFLLMGLAASGTYILNDLSDLSADRAHRTKHSRPFASGAIPVWQGASAAGGLVVSALAGASVLSPLFGALLAVYVLTSLSYSLALKKTPILDVGLLAVLYALRIGIGAVLSAAPLSQWLVVFALFFFLSLSLAKRHVEIVRAAQAAPGPIPGRGYRTTDAPLTLSLGIGSAMTSLLVMVLFLAFERFAPGVYSRPGFLWAAPMIIFLWLGRIWLLAARGELEDDPVSFAIVDRVSLFLGLLLAIFTLLALLDAR